MKEKSEVIKYMECLAKERREHADKMSHLETELVVLREFGDELAEAMGIDTGLESWWDVNECHRWKQLRDRAKQLNTTNRVTAALADLNLWMSIHWNGVPSGSTQLADIVKRLNGLQNIDEQKQPTA